MLLVVSWGTGVARGVVSLEAVCGRWGKVNVGSGSGSCGREVIIISRLRDALLARCSGRVSQMRNLFPPGSVRSRRQPDSRRRARYLNI